MAFPYIALHWPVSRILLLALVFPIPEGCEAAEKRGLAAGSMQKWSAIDRKHLWIQGLKRS